MRAKRNEEYDWLNDPFDEKKLAEELEQARSPKVAGCLLGAVALAAVALVGFALLGIAMLGAGVGAGA